MIQQVSLFDLASENDQFVRQINYTDVKPFIMGIHYARRMPCVQYAYGMFENGMLIGCVTYGQPASPSVCKGVAGEQHKHEVLELNRLVFLPGFNGENRASKLVGQSLRMLPHHTFVLSYADIGGWGHVGYVYQATNFIYTGMTKERTDPFCAASHPRHYSKDETRRQIRTAKYRYVYLVGDKRERKKMKKELKFPQYDKYPKGDTRHYDTSNPMGVII